MEIKYKVKSFMKLVPTKEEVPVYVVNDIEFDNENEALIYERRMKAKSIHFHNNSSIYTSDLSFNLVNCREDSVDLGIYTIHEYPCIIGLEKDVSDSCEIDLTELDLLIESLTKFRQDVVKFIVNKGEVDNDNN